MIISYKSLTYLNYQWFHFMRKKSISFSDHLKKLSKKARDRYEKGRYSFNELPKRVQRDIRNFANLLPYIQLDRITNPLKLEHLPPDVIREQKSFSLLNALTAGHIKDIGTSTPLKPKEISALATTCKRMNTIFHTSRLENMLPDLLWNVAAGEQDIVEKILRKFPGLLLYRGPATDYPGREFTKITAFELAYWNTDYRYMCNKMLDCIPDNKKGQQIAKSLLGQLERIDEVGVTYTFNNKKINEKHYDYNSLIKAMQDYSNLYPDNCNLMQDHWYQVVGKAEFETVAHVAQHICDASVTFESSPKFDAPTFNRTLIYIDYAEYYETWWNKGFKRNPEDKLGVNFAIKKVDGCTFADRSGLNNLKIMIDALTTLRDVRLEVDKPLLKRRLQVMAKQELEANSSMTPICSR